MRMHGGGWRSFIRYDEDQDQPDVSRALLHRVSEFASPYWKGVVIVLVTMLVVSLLSLIPPLLIRDLIDRAIPEKDHTRLNYLALGMIAVPLANGLLGVVQRYTSARIGEGIIFDLRRSVAVTPIDFRDMSRVNFPYMACRRYLARSPVSCFQAANATW